MGCLGKDELFGRYAILAGNLHQVRDGDVQLALFYFLILVSTDANSLCHLADGDVEHVAQSAQALTNLFQLFVHNIVYY